MKVGYIMKIKCKKTIIVEMERYPNNCKECPMFHTTSYSCHNERGTEGHCDLGYMSNCDMRDFYGNQLFYKCDIQNNKNITVKSLD